MKRKVLVSLLLGFQFAAAGQGTILFDTYVPGVVISRWSDYNGFLGEEFGAQLFVADRGGFLIPLFPPTTFGSGTRAGFVDPVLVTVPGHDPGENLLIAMGVFRTSQANALLGYQDVFVTLGRGASPGYLRGLPEQVIVPEPSPVILLLLFSCAGGLHSLATRVDRRGGSLDALRQSELRSVP